MSCHALGTQGTRTMPKDVRDVTRIRPKRGRGASRPGRRMTQMINVIGRLDTQRALKLFGDWTDRIAAGELPFDKPARPQGIERNLVHHARGTGARPPATCTT